MQFRSLFHTFVLLLSGAGLAWSASVPMLVTERNPHERHHVESPLFASGAPLEEILTSSTVVLPEFDASPYLAEDDKGKVGRLRTGIQRDLAVDLDRYGSWNRIQSGPKGPAWSYTIAIEAPGAYSTRLLLEDVNLPNGWSLYVYPETAPNLAFGPETRKSLQRFIDDDSSSLSSWWSQTIFEDTIVLEVIAPAYPGQLAPPSLEGVFTISGILHNYRPLLGQTWREEDGGRSTRELPCHLDVNCDPSWDPQQNAVGIMFFVSDGSGATCTGQLLNNVNNDRTPYFLSAQHCLGTQSVANTLNVVWFYETRSCNGTVPDFRQLPQNNGAAMLVARSGRTSADFSFMELRDPAPSGTTFAAWTTQDPNRFDATEGVHHPGGTHKRLTNYTVQATNVAFNSEGQFITAPDFTQANATDGAAEGGSSGSGLYKWNPSNSTYELIGTLSAGSGACGDTVSLYGMFSEIFPFIRRYIFDIPLSTPTPLPTQTPNPCSLPDDEDGQTFTQMATQTETKPGRICPSGDTDTWKLTVTSESQVIVTAQIPSELDVQFIVTDLQTGLWACEANNEGPSGWEICSFKAAPGDYTITVLSPDGSFTNTPYQLVVEIVPHQIPPVSPPRILAGGYTLLKSTSEPGLNTVTLSILSQQGVAPISQMDLLYLGVATGATFQQVGQDSWVFRFLVNDDELLALDSVLLEAKATDTTGQVSGDWPYMTVKP